MDDANFEVLRLNGEDMQRVAEFFDCDIDAAFEFARTIWLPDASQTAQRINRAIASCDYVSLVYLCDKLREGARCVGATKIMQYANEIERESRRESWFSLRCKARALTDAIDTLRSVLLDCAGASVACVNHGF